MIKILLCTIVITFSALAGWSRASVYTDRVRALNDLTANLKYLESEMAYRMEPVPVLLSRIGQNRRENGGNFFTAVAELLENGGAESLWDAWVIGLNTVFAKELLTSADRRIVEELGFELGKTDMENQKKLFSHCYSGLALAVERASQEASVKGKMYRGLGMSAGILTAVLLL